jgi:murein DD-endopeptidase MepM/ murein hydrolase activator NlpD
MAWITDYQRWLNETESLNNAQMIVNHFHTGWAKESLSAMCGNMRHESSINPDMYEFGYDWSADRGYGLVQWTPRSKYWDWATANSLDPRLGDSQLARIDYEVDNNIQWIPRSDYGNMTFEQFRTNSGNWSVDYLTEAFTWSYERPNATAGQESMSDRKAFANRCFNELDWSGSGVPPIGSKPAFPTTAGLPITSPYGWRTSPITGELDFHGAIDIGGNGVNHPIYATQSGIVLTNQWSDSAGWMVVIQHTGDTYFSRYLHLDSQSPIPVGTSVTKGQEIGTMGTTGNSTGIHLDFGISKINGGWNTEENTIDPEIYLQMTFGGENPNPPPNSDKRTQMIKMLLADTLNGWRF